MNAPLIGREVAASYERKWLGRLFPSHVSTRDPEDTDWRAIEAFWRDPRPALAEQARRREIFNAAMAPHYARVRAEQEARWAAEADLENRRD